MYSAIKERLQFYIKYMNFFNNYAYLYLSEVARIIRKSKRYLKPVRVNISKTNISIMVRDITDMHTLMSFLTENPYFKDKNIMNVLSKAKVIVDIGAHIGLFSILVAYMNKKAIIYAYEPYPENYRFLINNILLNKLHDRIIAYAYAIGDKDSMERLYIAESSLSHTIHPYWKHGKEYILVRSIRFSEIFQDNNIEYVDLLKVNCEGCEYHIFTPNNIQYLTRVKGLVVQCHNINSENNFGKIERLLNKLGFSTKIEHMDERHTFVYACIL